LRLFDFVVKDTIIIVFKLNCNGRPFHDWFDCKSDHFSQLIAIINLSSRRNLFCNKKSIESLPKIL